jgi:hypothetical protein
MTILTQQMLIDALAIRKLAELVLKFYPPIAKGLRQNLGYLSLVPRSQGSTLLLLLLLALSTLSSPFECNQPAVKQTYRLLELLKIVFIHLKAILCRTAELWPNFITSLHDKISCRPPLLIQTALQAQILDTLGRSRNEKLVIIVQ